MSEKENIYTSDSYFASKSAGNNNVPYAVKALRIYFKLVGSILPNLVSKQALNLFFTPRKSEIKSFKKRILKKGEPIYFTHKNEKLDGYKWGEGRKKALLIHGWEGTSASLGGFVPGLVENGYSVYAFDGPAHGAHKAVKTNMIDFGKAIIDIMDQIDPIDTIIAHSFGGSSIVYTLAKNDNKRTIENLVLVAAPSKINNVISRFTHYLNINKKIEDLMLESIMKQTKTEFSDFDLANYASQANVNRVLILHDEQDIVVPIEDAFHLSQNWPKSQLKAFSNLGHNEILWNKNVHDEVLNFLYFRF